ncbi:MAG: UvrD-helicase domain-containing protein [Bacilli bacterium]|nr:UvrD-helicase domain-containing protein [Bacilli bacterium]
MNFKGLNNVQIEAIKETEGPILIVAGAGSGKTRVLTHKVAYLIEQKKAEPENILAITFTNKAATEMKERIYELVGKEAFFIQISTFHSFGLKIIRENYKLLGYNANFIIMDSDDSLSIIKKILKDMNLDPKFYNPINIKNKISGAKNELLSPIDYEKYANTEFEKVVLKIYKKYNDTLLNNNAVDFDDLLMLPITLFREFPNVLKIYQEKYKYVLIDEYQDTNEAQYILSKMISAKYKNICVVGDGDQTIYSFRGANHKNIINFESDYNNVRTILLEENYRSTKTILGAANNVIKNNKYRKDKNLWCNAECGDQIKYYRAYDERDEARYVIRNIKEALANNISPDEIAILYRTNAQSRTMQEELLRENLSFKVVGSYYFYNRKEIKDLISYLRVIYNSADNHSLTRIINVPKRGIGSKTVEKLNDKAIEENKSIYDVIDSGKELEFKQLIEELKQEKDNLTLTELVENILVKSGLREELESEKTLEASLRLENLEEFKSITKHFEERKGVISLEEFLMEIALVSDINEHEDDNKQIQLMTVHAVKGLEFNTIFIIGLEEGLFPHINSLMESDGLEEERRLCYVAITRAKKSLYFVNARRRTLFGRDQVNPPSRFIEEVGPDYIETKEEIEGEVTINKEEYLYEEEMHYKTGDNVIHNEYGEGVIVEVSNSLLTIAFNKKIGIKKFMKNHKSIRKA